MLNQHRSRHLVIYIYIYIYIYVYKSFVISLTFLFATACLLGDG
jgi:hypothetical protein